MDLNYLSQFDTKEQHSKLYYYFDVTRRLKKYVANFLAYTGQYGRLLPFQNEILSDISQNSFLATTSVEAANMAYSQLWSNDNSSIVLEKLADSSKYDAFIDWLNTTNLCDAISLVIKDVIDLGYAFIYVEEISTAPYIKYRVLNPMLVAWSEYGDTFVYREHAFDKYNKAAKNVFHVLSKDASYSIDDEGIKRKSTMKFSSIVGIKPDSMYNLQGIGLNLLSTIDELTSITNAYNVHMSMHIKPPIVINAHSITEDSEIDLTPDAVIKLSDHYRSGQTQSPAAMVLDKYHNVLSNISEYLSLKRQDIQKAYRVDMLQAPDPTMRASAFQALRSKLYYVMLPALVSSSVGIYKRKMKIDLGKDYVLKVDTVANNASTASKVGNMSEFLNMVGMMNKMLGGSSYKLDPSLVIEEIGRTLKIDPSILLSTDDMKRALVNASRPQQQQPQPQQPLQPNIPVPQ